MAGTRVTPSEDFLRQLDEAEAAGVPARFVGAVGYLATDGGAHSPQAWATITCAQLINVAPSYRGNSGMALRDDAIAILETAFANIIAAERAALAVDEAQLERLTLLRPAATLVARAIGKAAAATPWAEHFGRDATVASIINVIGKDMATAVMIERSIFAEGRRETSKAARVFLARRDAEASGTAH